MQLVLKEKNTSILSIIVERRKIGYHLLFIRKRRNIILLLASKGEKYEHFIIKT
jgi:hypothetical protein